MLRSSFRTGFLVLVSVTLVLTACASPVPPQASATDTPVPPSLGLDLPADTPTPPAETAIKLAYTNAKKLKSFRADVDLGQGDTRFRIQEEINGTDIHSTTTTTYSKSETRLELLSVAGKVYAHGPYAPEDLPDDRWYLTQSEWPLQPRPVALNLVTALLVQGAVRAFRFGDEELDNLACAVYALDKEGTFEIWRGAFGLSFAGSSTPTRVDVGETKYWVCADGNPHQIKVNLVTREETLGSARVVTTLSVHLYDTNGDVTLQAPTEFSTIPTATPRPTYTRSPVRTPTVTPSAITPADATATAQAYQTGLATARKWPLVFSDTFESNVNVWPLKEDDESAHATAVVASGVYRWTARPEQSAFFWEVPDKRITQADLYASVEARRVAGKPNSAYGLVFRENATHDSLYAFLVNDEGKYRFLLIRQGTLSTLAPWTSSPAIRTGQVNRLAVHAQGAQIVLYINDQYVAQFRDDRLTTGAVGIAFDIAGGDDTAFEFDNLEVRAK